MAKLILNINTGLIRKICYLLIFLILSLIGCNKGNRNLVPAAGYPSVYPDYINVTIPYNIAPLNFMIAEDCSRIQATLSGKNTVIYVRGRNKIVIPHRRWKKLLSEQKNDSVRVEVKTLTKGSWTSYMPFSFYVSADPIDPYLSYRLIEPGYEVWYNLQICQRNLENFEEIPIIDNNLLNNGCINCHTYAMQDPSRSFFHLRTAGGGTMIQENGVFRKLNTATESTISACVYGNWHPGGRYITYSTNVIIPEFHSINNLRLEVYDTISDVVVLDILKNTLITTKNLTLPDKFETFPVFSSDGRKLFFCSAEAVKMPENFKSVKYSLCSIDFDPDSAGFGNSVDTLVSSFRTGRTVSQPKTSPDGKYILFTSFAYGNFPVWHKEADLNLIRLSDNHVDTIPSVNSDKPDSYHSWSSNSRWFVFASKRDNGMYGKPYFSHIDENGKCTKPFLLPQKNPAFYDYFLKSYNIPELSKGPVPFNAVDIEKAFKTLKAEPVKFRIVNPIESGDPY
jgi:hypothetical protein